MYVVSQQIHTRVLTLGVQSRNMKMVFDISNLGIELGNEN